MVKPGRIVVNLDGPASEALAELSEFTGLGQEALARRLLNGILGAITGAMETESDRELMEGSVFPPHKAGAKQGRLSASLPEPEWVAPGAEDMIPEQWEVKAGQKPEPDDGDGEPFDWNMLKSFQ